MDSITVIDDLNYLTIKDAKTRDVVLEIDFQETPYEYRRKRERALTKKYPLNDGSFIYAWSRK